MSGFDGIEYTIGLNNVLGDESLFEEILMMFYQDHHQDGEKLSIAIKNQDIAEAKHIAHTLKGVACSIGAMNLYEATKALEHGINDNQSQNCEKLLINVLPELNIVINGIALQLNVN
jgi:HPt (histidine-containing phosphotransfer) domain-containing protein